MNNKISIICQICNKNIFVSPCFKNRKFCSNSCRYKGHSKNLFNRPRKEKIELVCNFCQKKFFVVPSKKTTKYCNKICKDKAHKINMIGVNDTKIKLICLECNKEYKVKKSQAVRGSKYCSRSCAGKARYKINPLIYIKYGKEHSCYKECIDIRCKYCDKFFKKKPSLKDKIKYCSKKCSGLDQRGINSPHWRGGKINEYERDRKSPEYIFWRKNIYKRDNWTCQICYDNQGNNLEAHHIKKYINYPELRFSERNGITLCSKCHRKIYNKEEDYEQLFQNIVNKKYELVEV